MKIIYPLILVVLLASCQKESTPIVQQTPPPANGNNNNNNSGAYDTLSFQFMLETSAQRIEMDSIVFQNLTVVNGSLVVAGKFTALPSDIFQDPTSGLIFFNATNVKVQNSFDLNAANTGYHFRFDLYMSTNTYGPHTGDFFELGFNSGVPSYPINNQIVNGRTVLSCVQQY